MADEVKENNKQLVCEIKIDAEMMQKIVDEKVAQIELDIQEIRAKAIDEFAQELLKHQDGNVDTFVWCSDINRIAKQMKAGGENEND